MIISCSKGAHTHSYDLIWLGFTDKKDDTHHTDILGMITIKKGRYHLWE